MNKAPWISEKQDFSGLWGAFGLCDLHAVHPQGLNIPDEYALR